MGVLRSSTFLGDQFVYEAFIKNLLVTGKSRLIPEREDRRLQLYVDPAEIMVFPYSERKNRITALDYGAATKPSVNESECFRPWRQLSTVDTRHP